MIWNWIKFTIQDQKSASGVWFYGVSFVQTKKPFWGISSISDIKLKIPVVELESQQQNEQKCLN